MRSLILDFYWWLEQKICPGLRFSQYHYYQLLERVIPSSCRWADLGCGHQMFAYWMTAEQEAMAARARLLVGIDLDWEGLKRNPVVHHKVYGNLESVPLADTLFDVVTANMVVEHLEKPEAVLNEVNRLLRPGGLFIFHTPNARSWMMRLAVWCPQWLKNALAWVLEGRAEEDVFPTHYRMNTETDVRRLAAAAGFEVEGLTVVSSSAATAMLGPLSIIELLYLRWIQQPGHEHKRSNLLVVLRKKA